MSHEWNVYNVATHREGTVDDAIASVIVQLEEEGWEIFSVLWPDTLSHPKIVVRRKRGSR